MFETNTYQVIYLRWHRCDHRPNGAPVRSADLGDRFQIVSMLRVKIRFSSSFHCNHPQGLKPLVGPAIHLCGTQLSTDVGPLFYASCGTQLSTCVGPLLMPPVGPSVFCPRMRISPQWKSVCRAQFSRSDLHTQCGLHQTHL